MIIFIIILFFTFNSYSQNGIVKSYHSNGLIASEINYRDGIREGEANFYFENGNIKEQLNYLNGRVEGLVKIYNENGNLKETYVIEDGRREGPTSIFDENGNYVTDVYYENGKLVVLSNTDYNLSQNENVKSNEPETQLPKVTEKQNIVKKNKSSSAFLLPPEIDEDKLEDDPAFFSTVEVMPEPVGGNEAIYKKLIYPTEAKRNKVEGTVIIKAFIDEYGEVIDAQVIQSLGYGCDDIAKNAVYFAKFKPGLQKGKPVRVMMTIPINFNPQMNQN